MADFFLQVAGINRQFAQTVGISVDHRRTNKCEESLRVNVERLKEYKARLVVFPRHLKNIKKGDATKEEMANVQQIVGDIVAAPKAADAVTFSAITEVLFFFIFLVNIKIIGFLSTSHLNPPRDMPQSVVRAVMLVWLESVSSNPRLQRMRRKTSKESSF